MGIHYITTYLNNPTNFAKSARCALRAHLYYDNWLLRGYLQDITDTDYQNDWQRLVLAKDVHKPIGVCVLQNKPNPYVAVFVKPEYRRQRIGSTMLHTILDGSKDFAYTGGILGSRDFFQHYKES